MDENKLGAQWSLCPKCKNDDSDKCCDCTVLVGFQPVTICNIHVGSSMQYYHKYFEEK